MKYILLLAGIAAMLGMQACNSSSTPTAPPDYFAGLDKVGNYWIYENHEIDTNGVVQSESYLDSTWVDGVVNKAGRQATILVSRTFNSTQPSYDTTYVAKDGKSLYAYVAIADNPLNPAPTEPTWVLVAHADTTAGLTWPAIAPITYKGEQDFNGTPVILDIKIEAIVSIKADTTFTGANGVKYTTKGAGVLPKISGKIAPKATPFLSLTLGSTGGEGRQFYADGVGLVGERTDPSVFNIGDGSLVPPIKQSGTLRTILRYKLN